MKEQIFKLINEKLKEKDYIIISIEGGSGSGKSTLAEVISAKFDCNIFHMDDFFLTPELRTKDRLAEVGGNVDYMRFKSQVLDKLEENSFVYEKYDCSTNTFLNSETVFKKSLNIVEGVYSQHPHFGDIYDLKLYIAIDTDTQRKRILERNGEAMLERFLTEWIPLENMYYEKTGLPFKCDFVLHTYD